MSDTTTLAHSLAVVSETILAHTLPAPDSIAFEYVQPFGYTITVRLTNDSDYADWHDAIQPDANGCGMVYGHRHEAYVHIERT